MPIDKGNLQDGDSTTYENKKTYQALIGSLTYATMSTCPDIRYIMQFLSQANKHPMQQDWSAAKRVLQYLKGTRHVGIMFWRDPNIVHSKHDLEANANQDPLKPWGFCNANYAEDS